MTFGADHYVPVLKMKRGEKRALSELSASVRSKVTPLLQIVERTDKTVAAHLNTAFKGLADALRPFDRCFIDTSEIESDGLNAANAVFDRASSSGISYTPVASISRKSEIAAALAHQSNGLALRLRRKEFEQGGLAARVKTFMAQHSLGAKDTDLIVDLGSVDDLVTAGVQTLVSAFLREIPDLSLWKTFTLSACAFPLSMRSIDRNSYDLIERIDWKAWRDGQHARRQALVRLPTYSDCAIQHPRGVEGFDPRIHQVSASIRYTVPDRWLLIKGESTRYNPSKRQFPALATQLVYGHLMPHYQRSEHCRGCTFMKAAADGSDGLGSAEVWRRLGTIHHITTVVEDIESLPWP